MSRLLRLLMTAERGAIAALVALLAAPSGLGLLYLLRQERLLGYGQHLDGALPLQALAGGSAQPLLRVLVAFAAAGAGAGALLGVLTRLRRWLAVAAAAALAWILLLVGGAASYAVENSAPVASRLARQLHHRGLWWELAGLLLGLLAGMRAARRATAATLGGPAGEGHAPAEHTRAARLVAAHGRDSLDPFALRADKAFHFAAGGMLAYRVIGRTAIVAGDPIGPPGCAAAVLDAFAAEAVRRGLRVCATAVSPDGLAALELCGLRSLQIGAEALVDPRAFSLEGRRVRKVRQAVARVERAGWRVETCAARELDDATRAKLDGVEQAWRARQPRVCDGFAMTLGRLWGAPEDLDARYVLARDASGVLRGFLRFVSYDAGRGRSLDVMRRGDPDEPNGLGETMVVEALRDAAADGVEQVSLNFAGFAHVMAADPATLGPRRRLLRALLSSAHGRFQLERLVRFNAKFSPVWQPRYLLYQRRRDLPFAGLRALQAEGYVRAPVAATLPLRWEPAAHPPAGREPARVPAAVAFPRRRRVVALAGASRR